MTEESLRFLREKLTSEYGEGKTAEILHAFSVQRRTSLRVNTLKTDPLSVQAALAARSIPFESVPWYDAALLLPPDSEQAIESLGFYQSGEVYLQSLSSMLPPLLLDLQEGNNLLDMAAAPGGKTTQVATMSGNKVNITACERHSGRAERLKYNLLKQGAKRVNVMVCDAQKLSDFFAFDAVMLDAPCSGSGTVFLGEKSNAEFCEKLLLSVTKTQSALLQKGLKLLKKGKTLVYSTCSLFKEENERIVKGALESGACELIPIDPERFPGARFLPGEIPGVLTVLPDENYEGFFVAKLKKK